jgi:drug/metabolite transporter (DMT)-like permease
MIPEKPLFQRRPVIWCTALFCCLIWGVSYPVVKLSYQLMQIASGDLAGKLIFAGIRFTVAGSCTLLCARLGRRQPVRPPSGAWGGIALLGLLQTVLQYLFIYIGLAHTQSAKPSVLNQAGVFLLVLVPPLVFRQERLNAKKMLGCLLGLAGIFLINWHENFNWQFQMLGEGFVVLSSSAAAAGYLVSKKLAAHRDPLLLTGWQQLLGGLVLLVPGLAGGGQIALGRPAALLAMAFLSVSVALVYILWMKLLKYNPVSEIAVFKFGVPVVGMLTSSLILREQILAWNSLLALFLVSAGIVVVNGRMRRSGSPGP